VKASIPTLSSQGVITDPKRAMLYLFKSFLTIDKSVSNLWRGEVISLMYLIKQHAKNPNELRERVEENLIRIYNRYFDGVKVQVEIESATHLPMLDTPAFNLVMSILVEDGGRTHQLAATLEDAFKEGDRMYNRVVFKEK
jgi:ribosomal protein L21E